VRDLESNLDEEFSSVSLGKILLDFTVIMAQGVVHVHKQLFHFDSRSGPHIFLVYFWCPKCQEIVLIEFPFAGKNIEDQKFRPSENMVTIAFIVVIVALVFVGTSSCDFA
jgi:hypothetical protein